MMFKVLALVMVALLWPGFPATAKTGGIGRGGSGKGIRAPKAPKVPKGPSIKSPRIKSPRSPKVFSPRPVGRFHATPRSTRSIIGRSTRALDGDTFRADGTRFRVRGIDTPELGQPRAEAAKQRLGELLASGRVTVTPRAVDKFGRTVADVHVNGRNVADVMKAEGLSK